MQSNIRITRFTEHGGLIVFLLLICVIADPVLSLSVGSTELSINLGKTVQLAAGVCVLIVFCTILLNIITGKKP